MDPMDLLSSKNDVWIPFRAALASRGRRGMPWVPSILIVSKSITCVAFLNQVLPKS